MIDLFLGLNDQGYPYLFFLVMIGYLLKRYKLVSLQVLEIMNVLMTIGGVITLSLFTEQISTYFSGVAYESYAITNRMFGSYWFAYWFNFIGMAVLTQMLWFKKLRRNVAFSLLILLIPLFERLVFLLTVLNRDYLPTSWAITYPNANQVVYILLYFGLVFMIYFLMVRIKNFTAKA